MSGRTEKGRRRLQRRDGACKAWLDVSAISKQSELEVTEENTKYVDTSRADECFHALHQLYQNKELCDITLRASGQEFQCHRVVLASASKYFYTMFLGSFVEKNKGSIELSEITNDCLQVVLDFIYTGVVVVSTENAQDVFVAAHMLELNKLEDACADFMKNHLSHTNCIGFLYFARMYDRQELLQAAQSKIQKKFATVVQSEEFVQLVVDEAVEILSTHEISCKSSCEETVCDAALRWLTHDWPARRKHSFKLLQRIHLVHLDNAYFENLKNNKLLRSSPSLANLFEQVDYLRRFPDRWHEVDILLDMRQLRTCSHDRILMFGGVAGTERMERFGSFHGIIDDYLGWQNTWPPGIRHPKLVTLKGGQELCILHGATRGTSRAYKFCSSSGYVPMAPMKSKRSHFSLVHCDHSLYVIGGSKKGALCNSVQRYCSMEDKWTKITPIPYRLRASCAISYRGKVYVFGGQVPSSTVNPVAKKVTSALAVCYDPAIDKWHELPAMPTARAWAGCGIFKGTIYVMGGVSKECSKTEMDESDLRLEHTLSVTEIYNPHKETWTTGPSLPKPLASPGVLKHHATLYVIGGVSKSGSNCDVYHLRMDGSSWEVECNALSGNVRPSLYSSYTPVVLHSQVLSVSNSTYSESSSVANSSSLQSSASKFYADDSTDTDSSLEELTGPMVSHSSIDSLSSEGW